MNLFLNASTSRLVFVTKRIIASPWRIIPNIFAVKRIITPAGRRICRPRGSSTASAKLPEEVRDRQFELLLVRHLSMIESNVNEHPHHVTHRRTSQLNCLRSPAQILICPLLGFKTYKFQIIIYLFSNKI